MHASKSKALITDRLSTRSLTQLVNCHEESWVGLLLENQKLKNFNCNWNTLITPCMRPNRTHWLQTVCQLAAHSLSRSIVTKKAGSVIRQLGQNYNTYILIKPLKNPDILRTDTIGIKNFTQIPSLFSLKISFVLFLHVSKS